MADVQVFKRTSVPNTMSPYPLRGGGQKCKKPKIKSKFHQCDGENRSRSTIFLSPLWMVPSNNHVKFEWNACNWLGENCRTKLQSADASSETTQTHTWELNIIILCVEFISNTLSLNASLSNKCCLALCKDRHCTSSSKTWSFSFCEGMHFWNIQCWQSCMPGTSFYTQYRCCSFAVCTNYGIMMHIHQTNFKNLCFCSC